MKQKDVLTKNNDSLNVMFRGTPWNIDCLRKQTYFGMEWDLEEQNLAILKINSYRIRSEVPGKINEFMTV